MITRSEPARMLWFGVGRKAAAKLPAAGLLFIASSTGRVLLAERAWWLAEGGTWAAPGGVCDPDEDPLSAAFRETYEELDAPIDPDEVDIVAEFTTYDHRRAYTLFIAVVDDEFPVEVDNHETLDADWFDIEDAINTLKLHPGIRPQLLAMR